VIPLPPEKVRITVRLDRDIVNHFREQVQKVDRGRGNYQTLINDAPGIIYGDPALHSGSLFCPPRRTRK
jgi:BrnA antitoxin of type II toxin-antitoxin system